MKKVILITGTSSGFGKLMAITLAKAGYQVIASMRGVKNKNAAVAAELGALPNIEVVEMDVLSDESVNKAVDHVLNKYSRIDVLVNNAGVSGFGLFEAFTLDQVKNMFEANFYNVVRTYLAVLPSMRKNKSGLVINITSGASGHTLPFMIPYLAAKFGVESITEGLQDELSDFGIDNVSIQPGVYPTEINSKAGVHANRPDVAAAYGQGATEKFEALGKALFGKMAEFKMDPQAIADGVLKLIKMEQGKRPLRFPIDAIAQGTDIEFVESRAAIKAKWLSKYSG